MFANLKSQITKIDLKKIKIPGATIVVPLFIGCLVNSCFPATLKIGGFTTAVINGTGPLVGAFMLCIGASLSFKNAPKALWRGAVIISVKILTAIVIALLVSKFCNNNLLGLSMLSILGAMTVANNALYSGITANYGTEVDRGAVAMTTISVGPTVTMIVMNSSGQAVIPFWQIVGSILPLVLGMILGNCFPYMKKQLVNGIIPITMILGFVLGANMNFAQLVEGGLSGVLLGIIVLSGFVFTVLADRFLTRGSGIAGAAISSTAASAVATPAAMMAIDPNLAKAALIATPQIAAAVIITALATPWLTALVSKKFAKKSSK
ncbi:2-keto-3-deoxygluconate permease [Gardnerella vaginalis]|jgi:KDGT family 2-keto-3-deoxygluconate transporter|uniref:2-keto-3-deoxygluconate permease n=2 Tax=Gardnerella vaginalis TaxID=2702 RepID=A0ABD4ZD97_GARVA|nr:2-keto-3-deoxygluconate permease [Gardnerella vaginalis]ADP39096.1 putative 2-keto-3-deoxygluconate transporter [Gardnerella vaginalis ATCC 14019]AEF31925.1 putative 2-keto-3-deoxygluconate transporter [Gardnerella vaginalis HMP9231]AYZ22117.1 2-keto-3-deoxygluconate permease [Gardnerella vaginalis]EIK75747.1 2-keto-3-deoxygluconate permease [Gardnerella vaginalis 284V]KOS08822.1 2-keto-3-deoxygluconate permease [Gardnerella vaginalis]